MRTGGGRENIWTRVKIRVGDMVGFRASVGGRVKVRFRVQIWAETILISCSVLG